MDALEAIFTRRSTRRMKAELPPPELIQNIIEAGRVSSRKGKFCQSWRLSYRMPSPPWKSDPTPTFP